jgi:hypothetical protein
MLVAVAATALSSSPLMLGLGLVTMLQAPEAAAGEGSAALTARQSVAKYVNNLKADELFGFMLGRLMCWAEGVIENYSIHELAGSPMRGLGLR